VTICWLSLNWTGDQKIDDGFDLVLDGVFGWGVQLGGRRRFRAVSVGIVGVWAKHIGMISCVEVLLDA